MLSFKIVNIDGRNFEGVGSSKKNAKNEAAQLALQMAFNLELPQAPNSDIQSNSAGRDDFHFGDFISKFEFHYKSFQVNQLKPVLIITLSAGSWSNSTNV